MNSICMYLKCKSMFKKIFKSNLNDSSSHANKVRLKYDDFSRIRLIQASTF